MNAVEWRNRVPKVRVYELCSECAALKEDVKPREFWTATGRVTHKCCEDCRRKLHWQYHS